MMGRMYAPKPKCRDTDYIDFLIATPKAFCCTEAAAVQPESPDPPAHDAFTRLLHPPRARPRDALGRGPAPGPPQGRPAGPRRLDPGQALRQEDRPGHPPLVGQAQAGRPGHQPDHPGLDRRRPRHPLRLPALRQGQGRPDQERPLPGDAPARPRPAASSRGASPSTAGTRGLENLKAVRACGWTFLTQLKVNRKVDLDRQGYRAVAETAIAAGGTVVHLEGFGLDPGLQGRLPRRGH